MTQARNIIQTHQSPKNMIQSYSQLLEDIYIHMNCINVPRNDISLVEVGAFNGVKYSNTLMLEQQLQTMPAHLVEPSPLNQLKIRKSRPESPTYPFAISKEFGLVKFAGDAAVSGISSKLTAEYKKRWNVKDFSEYNVLTVPMNAFLKSTNLEYIDFLSIDVQGSELDLLKSMDWQVPIGYMCIELEGHHPSQDNECREILKNQGFKKIAKLHISEIYKFEDYDRANLLYDASKKASLEDYQLKPYAKKQLQNVEKELKESSN